MTVLRPALERLAFLDEKGWSQIALTGCFVVAREGWTC